jgi:hypothetical protein
MLTIKTAAQLRTAQHLKSFRAHPVSTGLSLAPVDRRRRAWATLHTAVSELRRQWLDAAWTDHQRSIRNRGDSR